MVTAANMDDAKDAWEFAQVRGKDFPWLEVVFADTKYHNYELHGRLSRHRRPHDFETVIKLAAIRRMFRRLAPAPRKGTERFRFKRRRRRETRQGFWNRL